MLDVNVISNKITEEGKVKIHFLLLAKSRCHLVGERSGDNHAIGLARAGTEDNTEAIKVITRGAGMHHLHGAAGEPEGHRPDGPAAGPFHQIVHLREARRQRGLREERPRGGSGGCSGSSGGGEGRARPLRWEEGEASGPPKESHGRVVGATRCRVENALHSPITPTKGRLKMLSFCY